MHGAELTRNHSHRDVRGAGVVLMYVCMYVCPSRPKNSEAIFCSQEVLVGPLFRV